MIEANLRTSGILLAGVAGGVAAGMFGVGGGIVIIPALVLLCGFDQHRAQGTSLVALVPPSGLLGLWEYSRVGCVSWRVGLVLMPGLFFGAILGGRLAQKLRSRPMRQVFAVLMFSIGVWESFSAWRR